MPSTYSIYNHILWNNAFAQKKHLEFIMTAITNCLPNCRPAFMFAQLSLPVLTCCVHVIMSACFTCSAESYWKINNAIRISSVQSFVLNIPQVHSRLSKTTSEPTCVIANICISKNLLLVSGVVDGISCL